MHSITIQYYNSIDMIYSSFFLMFVIQLLYKKWKKYLKGFLFYYYLTFNIRTITSFIQLKLTRTSSQKIFFSSNW